MVLSTLPGTLVLYYGDEIGMLDVYVPLDQRLDDMTRDQPGNPGRDRCRTPMPWSAEPGAGFTTPSARPWLPIGEHATANVQSEQADPGSVLALCRELDMLRRSAQVAQLARWSACCSTTRSGRSESAVRPPLQTFPLKWRSATLARSSVPSLHPPSPGRGAARSLER